MQIPQKLINALFILLLAVLFLSAKIYALEAEGDIIKLPEELYAEAAIGYRHYNVKGHRGKVGEYDALDTGSEANFLLQGRDDGNYFKISGDILDKRDQSYLLNFDFRRILQTELSYRRYRHFLGHDPLTNQDSFKDFSPDMDNGITLEEIKAQNTIKVPALPFLKFIADYRKYSKRGHRQATTVAKCSQCHVSSRNKRVNDSIDDVTVGVEAGIGPATIRYQHLWRNFKEDASPPVNNYGNGASFFLTRGAAVYSRVPDSKTRIHKISLNSKLPFESSLFAGYQWGQKSNRDTRNNIDFNNFAARLSKYVSRYLSTDLFYSNYHMDNDAPNGMERDIEKGGLNIKVRLMKRTGLKFTYQWENTDRNNYNEGSTIKKIFRMTLNHRISRKLRMHLKYQKTKADDPFLMKDRTFRNLIQTSVTNNNDEVYLSVDWSPKSNFSLNTNLRYFKGEHDHYGVDENRYEFAVRLWYVPFERMTLTGSFTLTDNEVDTPVSFKTYHLKNLASLFVFDEIPYDDRSQSYYLSVGYRLSPRISLASDLTYIHSIADFDTSLDSVNVGKLSNLEIDQIEVSLGFVYLYSTNLSLYAKYMYREYDDKESNYLDGQFSLFSFAANWLF